MIEYKVKDHEPSFLPEGYDWKMVWNDEFDGTELDETKWDYRLHMMGKRHITWQKEGISFDGKSNIIFKIFEKDGEICSTQLQTGANFADAPTSSSMIANRFIWPVGKLKEPKFLHRYGYYECRCKLQKMPGWWSAFWLQSPVQGTTLNPEISGIENDIMESFEPGKIIKHINHYNGCGADYRYVEHGNGMDISLDEYHRFGMLWTEEGYTFYVDGKEDGHSSAPVSKIPQFILLSTEVNGYRRDEYTATDEAKAAARAGDEFIVDYVRVFDIVKPQVK